MTCVDGVVEYARPNPDMTATGTNGEVYTASYATLAHGNDFEGVNLHAGEHVTGWVAFDIPEGVTVQSVRYEPSVLSDASVTWTIGK